MTNEQGIVHSDLTMKKVRTAIGVVFAEIYDLNFATISKL
jgi:hypothetical protein